MPCPGSEATLPRASGWALTCAFLLWTASAPRVLPSRHSSVPSAPGPQRGHSSLCSHLALFGFLSAVSALGPHCSAPGGSSNSCCCPWGFQSLRLQLRGFPFTDLLFCVGQCRVAWGPSGSLHTHHLCQKLWRHPSPSHLFRLWHGLCAGRMWK